MLQVDSSRSGLLTSAGVHLQAGLLVESWRAVYILQVVEIRNMTTVRLEQRFVDLYSMYIQCTSCIPKGIRYAVYSYYTASCCGPSRSCCERAEQRKPLPSMESQAQHKITMTEPENLLASERKGRPKHWEQNGKDGEKGRIRVSSGRTLQSVASSAAAVDSGGCAAETQKRQRVPRIYHSPKRF